jgi:hypothetical protein
MFQHTPKPSSTRSGSPISAPLSSQETRFARFQICKTGDVWVSIDPAAVSRMMGKAMSGRAAMLRLNRERTTARAEAAENRAAARSLLMEERESERRNRALWRKFKVRAERKIAPTPARKAKGVVNMPASRPIFLAGANRLPSYWGPVIDRQGRRGVFLRIRYYGRDAKMGVGLRLTRYIADGAVRFRSNVGETPEEAMAAMELIEQANRAAQANGKAVFQIIANVPYQLTEDQQFAIGIEFAEQVFGSRDLPFAVALHEPSAEGDQRNTHLHIVFATRPMVRIGDHQWEVGEVLRREIDNPEAFRAMRELYAAIQTDVARRGGMDVEYTALSNAARGLAIAPQEHLDGKATAMVRRGLDVAANERNWQASLAGERAMLDEQLRHAQANVTKSVGEIGDAVTQRMSDARTLMRAIVPCLASVQAVARPVSIPPRASRTVSDVAARRRGIPPVANLQSHAIPVEIPAHSGSRAAVQRSVRPALAGFSLPSQSLVPVPAPSRSRPGAIAIGLRPRVSFAARLAQRAMTLGAASVAVRLSLPKPGSPQPALPAKLPLVSTVRIPSTRHPEPALESPIFDLLALASGTTSKPRKTASPLLPLPAAETEARGIVLAEAQRLLDAVQARQDKVEAGADEVDRSQSVVAADGLAKASAWMRAARIYDANADDDDMPPTRRINIVARDGVDRAPEPAANIVRPARPPDISR